MKFKKILSSFLACTVLGTVSQIYSAAEEKNPIQEALILQKKAQEDINNCQLQPQMNLAECRFDKGNNVIATVYKYRDGNTLWKEGDQSFAILDGDKIWVNNGKTEFIKPKDGMLSKEKLYSYATKWNVFPEAVLKVKDSVDDASNQVFGPNHEHSYVWVPSFKTLLFTCSAVGLIYLVYKNIKFALSKNNQANP